MTFEEDDAYEKGYEDGCRDATKYWMEQLGKIQIAIEEIDKKMTHELYGESDENLHQ